MIKVQIAVNHISSNAIEKVPEHTDNTSCLMTFKLKVIFQYFPVGFNDASVLDMITLKTAYKSVNIRPRFPLNFEIRNSYIRFPLRLLKNMLVKL